MTAGVDSPPPCAGQSHHDFGVGFVSCANRGKVLRDGLWYCGVHDPVKVAEKRAKRREEYDRASALARKASDEGEAVARRMSNALGVPCHVRYRYDKGRTRVDGIVFSIQAALTYLDGS